ncbi:MAG: helix-hairpin-helix domain-containing protein [Promethearchaeota archaeon]
MENYKNTVAIVISPAKDAHKREAKGFSLSEIKEAGKTPELLRALNVSVDYFRRSTHVDNVEQLKKLKPVGKKGKKKKPYVFKEKKRTPFKPKVEKKVRKKPVKVEKTEIKLKITKKAPPPKKEIDEVELKPVKKEKKEKKEKLKSEKTKLTSLSGLGPSAAKKLEAIGVSCVEELIKENPGELAPLIKGISEERISKWCEEGKELLK